MDEVWDEMVDFWSIQSTSSFEKKVDLFALLDFFWGGSDWHYIVPYYTLIT